LLPNKYTSTAQLMPPDQQTFANASTLSALSGAGALLPSGGGLLSARTPGSTAIGVLSSATVQDDLINRFSLLHVYRAKHYVDARRVLAARTTMEEDKKSGLIIISVTDKDRYLARDLTKAYIEELNKVLNLENTSSAHRERVFLEDRLSSLKTSLDTTTEQLSKFSSRNATINPQTQGQALIESASRLQAELITAQAELYGLKAQYSDDNVRVRSLQARIDELQSQLRKMNGIGEQNNSADLQAGQLSPSIRELPLLGATYSDLFRQVTMQENIYEALTKQYELAKVQEAKELPTIKVLDEPDVPELKSSPHRTILILIITFLSAFAVIAGVLVRRLWELMSSSNALKRVPTTVFRYIRGEG